MNSVTDSTEIARIRVHGLFHVVLNALLTSSKRALLTTDGILLEARSPIGLKFEDLATRVSITRKIGLFFLVFTQKGGSKIQVGPVRKLKALAFAERVNEQWKQHFTTSIELHQTEISELSAVVSHLRNPQFYPSACWLQPYLKMARTLTSLLPQPIPEHLIDPVQREHIDNVRQLSRQPSHLRKQATQTFVARKLKECTSFFDTIDNHPLTPEQRLAIVTDEDATLVLAGAGSGKTSVITTKAVYLIQERIREPQEILLVTFAKKAAEEMAERVEKKCGRPVTAITFHALGNSILREVENPPPSLANHADDSPKARKLMQTVLLEDILPMPGMDDKLCRWFGELIIPDKSEWDFKTWDEYYKYIEDHGEFRTLKGDKVKSHEELQIANWLFLNGIDYEYEPDYEHSISGTTYKPDFRLTASGVYIEHFGVRRKRTSDGQEILHTAPFVDHEDYLQTMDWKRRTHEQNGTVLIETFSYEQVEGRLIASLAKKIAPYATPNPISIEPMFEMLKELGTIDSFSKILAQFLCLFKNGSMSFDQCRKRGEESSWPTRNAAFLDIFEPLYNAYQKRLGEQIDFEDMILRATDHVLAGRYRSPYRHLLVDEFQDISEGCSKLLLALKEQHTDGRIFGVGDDWQSIYRFRGSDIYIMRNFGKEFGGKFDDQAEVHESVDLAQTFRSVDRIALPARRFILENPSQIQKRTIPFRKTESPAITVHYHSQSQQDEALLETLHRIESHLSRGGNATVGLLGRYNHLQPANLAELKQNHDSLKLDFMTVHKSKGLETDHVIILRASSGSWGFPSPVVDDPLFDLVLPEAEDFDHAEERRLFYVALTRARYTVTLLADQDNPSPFVLELAQYPEVAAIGDHAVDGQKCEKCGGRLLSKRNSRSDQIFFACEHRTLCGFTLSSCQECNHSLPVPDNEKPGSMKCKCGSVYHACPSCSSGWLVRRSGPYSEFLGCIRYPQCRGKRPLS